MIDPNLSAFILPRLNFPLTKPLKICCLPLLIKAPQPSSSPNSLKQIDFVT
uniref:Uncharacterized protein n=1 Tax=Anguilla anguilla TaxID=7936 RepID=A0A0E9PKN6_ANGAN